MTSATRLTQPLQESAPAPLWEFFQKQKARLDSVKRPWADQWEIVLDLPGVNAKEPNGCVLMRHKSCGATYSTLNMSRSNDKHHCDKARTGNGRRVDEVLDPSHLEEDRPAKKKAVLEAFFLTASQRDQFRQLLATAILENCGSVPLSFISSPAMREFLEKSGIGPISRQWLAGPGLARAYEAAQQEQTELIIVEQVGQIATDAWKKQGVNNDEKLINAGGLFPSGASTFIGVAYCDGSSLTGTAIAEHIRGLAVKAFPDGEGGISEKCLGFIGDGEAALQLAFRLLKAEFPHLVNISCQAHSFNLLLKDIVQSYSPYQTAIESAREITRLANTAGPSRLRIKREFNNLNEEKRQEYEANQDPGDKKGPFQPTSTRLPRFPAETRFGTSVIMIQDVLRCLPALQRASMIVLSDSDDPVADDEVLSDLHGLVNAQDVVTGLREAEEMLGPLLDVITNLEADRPLFCTAFPLWKKKVDKHVLSCAKKHDRRNGGIRIKNAFVKRAFTGYETSALNADGHFIPPWGSLVDAERKQCEDAVTDMDYDDSGLLTEFHQFVGSGYPAAASGFITSAKGKDGTGAAVGKSILRRAVWSGAMDRQFPLLTKAALKLLSMHATACASERNWSRWHWVCRNNRRKLTAEKAEKLIFIASMAALKRKRGLSSLEEQDMQLMEELAVAEANGELDVVDLEEDLSYEDQLAQGL